MTQSYLPFIAAGLFALAVLHTFGTKYFEHLAHTHPRHAGLWHLLGEVEVVFGVWAIVLATIMFFMVGKAPTLEYLESRNFTEPLFVFAIMVVAGTRPILQACGVLVQQVARITPLPKALVNYFLLLAVVPLLGSWITEPAAMTLAALMLRDSVFSQAVSERLKYATLGVLFVNISIGGTLTPFAAPPVLMVANTWQWDLAFMLHTFGWKAAIAVVLNAGLLTLAMRRELMGLGKPTAARLTVPPVMVAVHLPSCWASCCSPTTPWCSWACCCSSSATPRPTRPTRIARSCAKPCSWPSSWRAWWCSAASRPGGCSHCWWNSAPTPSSTA